MTKEEACELLQVSPTAAQEITTQAYWYLARKYQASAGRNKQARQRLDELNQAYRVLHPKAKEVPAPPATPAKPSQELGEDFIASVRQLFGQIKSRWQGSATEIGILTATVCWLGFLAFSAGASPLFTLLALAIAGVTIWAPWRRA